MINEQILEYCKLNNININSKYYADYCTIFMFRLNLNMEITICINTRGLQDLFKTINEPLIDMINVTILHELGHFLQYKTHGIERMNELIANQKLDMEYDAWNRAYSLARRLNVKWIPEVRKIALQTYKE